MKVLREWVASKPGDELFYEAQRRHQPFGVVWDVAKALESPQINARGYLKPKMVPGFGEVPFPGRLVSTSVDTGHPAPATRVEVSDLGWRSRPAARVTGVGPRPSWPLEGIRIVDFTHVLAGPFGTRVLGDLGADVLKIGTAARGAGANTPEHPYYTCWNRNKRSVSINMATDGGRRLARQLASKCDVIMENFSAGVLKRWGLDRSSMAAENPGLTVISMGGMGQTGPWSDFVTFAPTIHALTGLTYLTNPPGRHDLGYGFSLTDHLSGLAGAFAALEGLAHRERTGEGLDIDLAQYELGLGIMAPAYLDYLSNGVNPEPVGNRHPYNAWAPHNIYPAAGRDRWVAIVVRGDEQWRALCGAMGRDDLAVDRRFANHDDRVANQDDLDSAISAWTCGLDRYEVMRRCQAAGVAAGAVQDGEDLNVRDPQLAARAFFGVTRSAHWGEYGVDRFPAHFNGERPSVYEGVHGIGEDTFAVLTDILELPDDEVAALAEEGALS
jgi:crotonobetainyl-CoA:carnitine CoA-transferase CaiB-like acyl-CoA transferase